MNEAELQQREAMLAAWEEALKRDNDAISTVLGQWHRAMIQQRRELMFHSFYVLLCGVVIGASMMKAFLTG